MKIGFNKYTSLIRRLADIIHSARATAVRQINKAQVLAYYEIGREMGKGFAFVARQKRITVGNRHYYVDLVFYNRILKCTVLIDLKIDELDHSDIGQMNFYLNYFKENEKVNDENDPIGLILCAKKDEVFAKYVLGNLNNKIFASKYKLALPTEKELARKISALHLLEDKNEV